MQLIRQYSFYWSPEGRKLGTYTGTLRQCRAQFKREFPRHARYMGEVYTTESEISFETPEGPGQAKYASHFKGGNR